MPRRGDVRPHAGRSVAEEPAHGIIIDSHPLTRHGHPRHPCDDPGGIRAPLPTSLSELIELNSAFLACAVNALLTGARAVLPWSASVGPRHRRSTTGAQRRSFITWPTIRLYFVTHWRLRVLLPDAARSASGTNEVAGGNTSTRGVRGQFTVEEQAFRHIVATAVQQMAKVVLRGLQLFDPLSHRRDLFADGALPHAVRDLSRSHDGSLVQWHLADHAAEVGQPNATEISVAVDSPAAVAGGLGDHFLAFPPPQRRRREAVQRRCCADRDRWIAHRPI